MTKQKSDVETGIIFTYFFATSSAAMRVLAYLAFASVNCLQFQTRKILTTGAKNFTKPKHHLRAALLNTNKSSNNLDKNQ